MRVSSYLVACLVVIDMDPLEQAKKLREEYERALDAAESRRTAYHQAVLDLHRSGTPLREIAKELGLSHQRVHQMVSGDTARPRKLPRAAGGIAGVLVLFAATCGALWLARAEPFVSHDGRTAPAGQHVLRARLSLVAFRAFGGIRRPPGGAALRKKQEVLTRATVIGQASIWRAPDRVSPAQCQWLVIDRAVWGGSCLRNSTLRSGLPEVVPLVLLIRGRSLPLLWGVAGANVARLSINFRDGSHRNLSIRDGIFLYPVPGSRWNKGHRPAFLIARDRHNRVVSKRPIYGRTTP
jgi:hypothetical protein